MLIDLHLHTSTIWTFPALPSSSIQNKARHHCVTMSPAADHFLR